MWTWQELNFIHLINIILTPAVIIPNVSQKREVNREKLFCKQMHQMAAVSGPLSSYHLKQAHMFCNAKSSNVPIYLIIRVIPLRSCPGRARLCAECDVICVFTVFIFHTFHTNSTELDCRQHYSYLQKNALLRHLPSSLLWLSVSSWKSLTFLDFFFFMGSIKSSSSCVSDGSVSIFSSFWKFAIYLVKDDACRLLSVLNRSNAKRIWCVGCWKHLGGSA